MTSRRTVALTLAAVALGVAATWRATAWPSVEDAPASSTSAPLPTALVARRDLIETEVVSGALGFGTSSPVIGQLQGTITGLPAPGSVVGPGQPLYEVDGRPVLLFPGTRPMYRKAEPAMTAGEDVRQLEQALIDVGHAKGTGLTKANTEWSDATTAAVKQWEKATGRPEDGTVELGEVVYLPTPVRVSSRSVGVGAAAQPGSAVLQATATTRVVTVELSAVKAAKVKVGDVVGISLPDRTTVDGAVAAVGTKATKENQSGSGGESGGSGGASGSGGGSSSEPKVTLTVTIADEAKLGSLEEAPVEVRLTKDQATGVLAVPVGALLALAEGGYAVEVVKPGADSRLVPVETGLFAGTFVEVRNPDLQAGTPVVVPA